MKKLALHWQIIIGMGLGLVVGLVAINFKLSHYVLDWIKPFGTIFINLLKLIAVPLVIASLIKGVTSLKDISQLSRIGTKTIALYIVSTVFAVSIGLLIVNSIKPGKSFSPEKREQLKQQYASNASSQTENAEKLKSAGPLQFLIDVVPSNIFDSVKDNRNMLQIIFFALLFGIAIIMVPSEQVNVVKQFFEGVNDIIIKIVELIMLAAPYGVFSLLSGLIVEIAGDNPSSAVEILMALSIYSLSVIMGLAIMVFVFYPIVLKSFTKVGFKEFYDAILPAQMLAFSTSSSAATLPVTMDCNEKNLGISKEISSFVLPLGATINMDGTSLYQAVAAVFIAQVFGINLTLGDQLTIVLIATLASIGTAAVPGAGTIMLVIVLGSIGVDPEGIALIFAVDRILDMCRTVVNVTGDSVVASIIATSEGKIIKPLREL